MKGNPMKRRTISKRTQETLASEWQLRLDGSGENCMDVTSSLDERGLTLTGSLEAVIEAIAFIALEVGSSTDDDAGDDLVNGLINPQLIGPNTSNEFEMRFPHFRVA